MPAPAEIAFACDAMHGGLARWLRAAGYDASWTYGIEDARLVGEARASGRIVVTSDAGILVRRVVRLGEVRVFFVPRGLGVDDQLASVLGALALPLREPRCMHCGGEPRAVDRESVAAEAPPRTFRWIESFQRCTRCGALLWRGTHWSKIEARLLAVAARVERAARSIESPPHVRT